MKINYFITVLALCIAKNEQIYPSANLRDALRGMIERLKIIDEANLIFRQRLEAVNEVVSAFNLNGCAVFISNNAEILRELGTQINYNRF